MTIVSSYDVENDTWTHHNGENPTRQLWRTVVAEISEKAKAALPECVGRIEKATAIALSGDIELLPEGKAKVSSQSNGTTEYFVVNGECSCKDFPKAPNGFCKHRLSVAIYKRAYALTKERLEAQGESPRSEPVSPGPASPIEASGTTTAHIPAQFLTEIHGKQFVQYAGLLAMAHERGLVTLSAHFISVTGDLALGEATAEFRDGKIFKECGDATPANVHPKVKQHFPRMALTRAKARCLRDALNISVCSVEEMEA